MACYGDSFTFFYLNAVLETFFEMLLARVRVLKGQQVGNVRKVEFEVPSCEVKNITLRSVKPYITFKVNLRFRGTYCLHI
jgi:hypothetical protein